MSLRPRQAGESARAPPPRIDKVLDVGNKYYNPANRASQVFTLLELTRLFVGYRNADDVKARADGGYLVDRQVPVPPWYKEWASRIWIDISKHQEVMVTKGVFVAITFERPAMLYIFTNPMNMKGSLKLEKRVDDCIWQEEAGAALFLLPDGEVGRLGEAEAATRAAAVKRARK